MDNADVLAPEYETVKVGARDYQISELSPFQIIRLIRFVSKNIFLDKEKMATLVKRFENSESNFDDAFEIIETIGEKDLPEFIGIVLKENDIEYLKHSLNSTNLTGIIAAFLEQNESILVEESQLKKNILRLTNSKIAKYLIKIMTKEKTESKTPL